MTLDFILDAVIRAVQQAWREATEEHPAAQAVPL